MAEQDESEVVDPTTLRYVGPVTADVIETATFDASDIIGRRVSHARLVDAGVNPGVAAKIRREFSLSWSFESGGEDLARRADQVRGLGDEERAWVAASSGNWESRDAGTADASTDGSGAVEDAEAAWRDRSKPTPVTDVDGVGEVYAERLAEGGIRSVRSLALADPEEVAGSLDFDEEKIRRWQRDARERL